MLKDLTTGTSGGAVLARGIAALLAATLALVAADLAAGSGSVDLKRYRSWLARGPRVTLPGFWPAASVSADVRVHRLRRSGTLSVTAGGQPVRLYPGATGPQQALVEGVADPDGRLVVGIAPRGSATFPRIAFRQRGPRRVALLRLLQYALLAGLAYAWGLRSAGSMAGLAAVAAATLSIVAAMMLGARVQVLVFLPWALVLLGLALLLAAGARWAGLPPRATAFVSLVFLLRTTLFLQPGFPSVDAGFHSANVLRFEAGDVIRSTAPGPGGVDVPVPYPPALYALLQPFVPGDYPTPELPVRLALALLEGAMPLLLLLVARAAGASPAAAALAACVLAALPEGVLVLGKGIAANALGQAATLLLLLGLVRRVHAVVLVGLCALVFLCHFGAGLILVAFLGCWTLSGLRAGGTPREAARTVACAGAGAVVAWLAYYREVDALTSAVVDQAGSSVVGHARDFFGVRWYRVGKTLQDLVLKAGAAPLVAGAAGLRRSDLAPALRALLWSWLVSGAGVGLVALLTPIPLRFEYYLGPAVALAAGLGAESLGRRGRAVVLAVPLLVQALLAAALWAGRFNLISVILESPRWPFPLRL